MGRRALRNIDPNLLGMAAARPGIDPRTWCMVGKIVEIHYDREGFMVGVEVLQGAHAGEVIACELADPMPGTALLSLPFAVGDECVCVVPEGDANTTPLVVGFLRPRSSSAPASINGEPISAALLASTIVLASDHPLEVAVAAVRLVAGSISLGSTTEPAEPFVRGQALADALGQLLTTVGPAATAAAQACIGPLVPLRPFFELVGTECAALRGKLVPGVVLSTTIRGD